MMETSILKKNKVSLTDYNCEQDINNRMLMADFSTFELEVLEEILFSPLKISVKKLSRNVECDEEELSPILQKLTQTGLLSRQEDTLIVDKDLRKYFEFQIVRFDPDFKPDMEFLSALLRKVSIHFLPSWYSIPRTSNNIFESIVEKYLLTPQIFQRYLSDLHFGNNAIHGIISDLFSSPDFKLYSSDVISKYNLERSHFEELMLLLEFNFVGCVSFEKADDHWIEIITPFYEWHQYLKFLRSTESPRLPKDSSIVRLREDDFAFLEDMSKILIAATKKPLALSSWKIGEPLAPKLLQELAGLIGLNLDLKETTQWASYYLGSILQKLLLIDLASLKDSTFSAVPSSKSWLGLSLEQKALHLYRHPKNQILNPSLSPKVASERNIREAEKSIKRVLHGDWVLFEDFFKGVIITLSENSVIMLKKTGKHWKYSLPVYDEAEKNLLKTTLFEWLFETGMVKVGTYQGKDCFAVTPFGRFFFEE